MLSLLLALAIATPPATQHAGGFLHDIYDDSGRLSGINKLVLQGTAARDATDPSKLLLKSAVDQTMTGTTSGATTRTMGFVAIPANTAMNIEVTCVGMRSDEAAGASYMRSAAFRRGSTTAVLQIGSTRTIGTDNETDSTWTGASMAEGVAQVAVQVTGLAATGITWRCNTRSTSILSIL